MLRAVVPLMRARDAVVNELVALAHRHPWWICCRPAAWRIPCFAAVIRALNDLPEPRAGLRGVDSIRISRRPFHMINFPAGKMRPVYLPVFAPCIRGQDEGAFPCSSQYSYHAHWLKLLTADHAVAHGFVAAVPIDCCRGGRVARNPRHFAADTAASTEESPLAQNSVPEFRRCGNRRCH